MPNPLYQQLQPMQQQGGNNIIKQFLDFKRTFTGDPKQVVQQMLNTGRITQTQLNNLSQQADQIYRLIYGKK